MKLAYAFLADYALANPDGKLYVLGGGIERILTESFPAQAAVLSIVARFLFTARECDREYQLKVAVRDVDGQIVSQLEAKIVPKLPAELASGELVPYQMVLTLSGLAFKRAGVMEFLISLDDDRVGRLPLRIVQQKKIEAAPPGGSTAIPERPPAGSSPSRVPSRRAR